MGRVSAFGFVVGVAVLGWSEVAEAGGARAAPAVHVIAPGTASGVAMEPDDLPAPQLEVVKHPVAIDVPAIPAFGASPAGQANGANGPSVATGASSASSAAGRSHRLEIDLDVSAGPALRRFVDDATLDASLAQLAACNKANAVRQYEGAIAACRAATKVWPDNHLAWYALASAHLARQDWAEAKAAAEHAVAGRPDRAMYQLYRGIALYELERRRVRDLQARDGRKSDGVELDPALLQLDDARDALATAVRLEPALWRAHYYLGRVHRDLGDARRAAQQFSETIRLHPGHRFSYIALTELYRGRDHADRALAVALLGTTHVPAAEAAELWFEVGMAYEARPADAQTLDRAIDAYGRALAINPGDALAKLRRGQLHVRTGDLASAARDLEDVLRSDDPRAASARHVVTALLAQIASQLDSRTRGGRWACERSGTAIVCQPRTR